MSTVFVCQLVGVFSCVTDKHTHSARVQPHKTLIRRSDLLAFDNLTGWPIGALFLTGACSHIKIRLIGRAVILIIISMGAIGEPSVVHTCTTGHRNPQDCKRTRMIIYVRWFPAHTEKEYAVQTGIQWLDVARRLRNWLCTTKMFARAAVRTYSELMMLVAAIWQIRAVSHNKKNMFKQHKTARTVSYARKIVNITQWLLTTLGNQMQIFMSVNSTRKLRDRVYLTVLTAHRIRYNAPSIGSTGPCLLVRYRVTWNRVNTVTLQRRIPRTANLMIIKSA